jgi:virginiamycin B lyase
MVVQRAAEATLSLPKALRRISIGALIFLLAGCGREAAFTEQRSPVAADIPTAIAVAPDDTVWFSIEFSRAIGRVRGVEALRAGKVERIDKGSENLEPLGLAAAADGSVWFTDAPARKITRLKPDGQFESAQLDTPIAKLGKLAVAPDGAVWFAEGSMYSLTRLHNGVLKRHVVPTPRGNPYAVAVDRAGNAWATVSNANELLRVTPAGEITSIDVPSYGSAPGDIAIDAQGAIWFLQFRTNKLARYAEGKFEEFPVPGEKAGLAGLAAAPDGALWFAMLRRHSLCRYKSGVFTEFALPRGDARPVSVAIDSKGNVWYADLSGWIGLLARAQAQSD